MLARDKVDGELLRAIRSLLGRVKHESMGTLKMVFYLSRCLARVCDVAMAV